MEKPKFIGYYKDLLPKNIYDIYCGVYWSNFRYVIQEKEELEELIKNREIIAERYQFKKRTTNIPKKYYGN